MSRTEHRVGYADIKPGADRDDLIGAFVEALENALTFQPYETEKISTVLWDQASIESDVETEEERTYFDANPVINSRNTLRLEIPVVYSD